MIYRYRIFEADGTDVGEASYAVIIKPDEIIHVAGGGRMRVLDLVQVREEDSPFTGLLKIEPASVAAEGEAPA